MTPALRKAVMNGSASAVSAGVQAYRAFAAQKTADTHRRTMKEELERSRAPEQPLLDQLLSAAGLIRNATKGK